MSTPTPPEERFPRVTIQFCTQCRWMLRAAYYAQELLSTFSTSLGQVSLQPCTGGVFTISIEASGADEAGSSTPEVRILWDRKRDGGFPEVKELKRRVRDVVDPGRHLGHVDGHVGGKGDHQQKDQGGNRAENQGTDRGGEEEATKQVCEDCGGG
ncbi:hypothetical protein E4U55_000144 [Claviceps digitariae]|nr:hypothetical protein E4U55_000144 [Claviceps digitariae]